MKALTRKDDLVKGIDGCACSIRLSFRQEDSLMEIEDQESKAKGYHVTADEGYQYETMFGEEIDNLLWSNIV